MCIKRSRGQNLSDPHHPSDAVEQPQEMSGNLTLVCLPLVLRMAQWVDIHICALPNSALKICVAAACGFL